MPALLIVDAPSLLYRNFHALPRTITDASGRAVNALLGSATYVLKVVEEHAPRAVVFCSGPDAATYRTELFAGYHANRPPVPDELAPQFADAPDFFGAFGWSWVESDSVEADDLLGSYASAEEAAGGTALLLTGDRDMYQCVTENVAMLYMKTGNVGPERVGPEEVRRRYGISPRLVPDFIALRGDPSDGIPGAKGIGEKKAADLLQRHGSLETAIANAIRERPMRVCAALREQADELRRFRQIATLRSVDVTLPEDRATDRLGGAAAARERGMNRLADRLLGSP